MAEDRHEQKTRSGRDTAIGDELTDDEREVDEAQRTIAEGTAVTDESENAEVVGGAERSTRTGYGETGVRGLGGTLGGPPLPEGMPGHERGVPTGQEPPLAPRTPDTGGSSFEPASIQVTPADSPANPNKGKQDEAPEEEDEKKHSDTFDGR